MNRVLILGGSGLIGKSIQMEMDKCMDLEIYSTYYEHPSTFLNEHKSFRLNINKPENIDCILNNVKPKVIISCLRGDYDKLLILHT